MGLILSGCTIQSSLSNRYLTAEKLWTEKNYVASVIEFDRIVKETPNTHLGLQSLWRASVTRTLFLNEQDLALNGFQAFLDRASDSDLAPQAQKEIGEIYFSKQAEYTKAIDYYQELLKSKKFSEEDRALFLYRVARSYFLLNKIRKAIEVGTDLVKQHPHSPYALKAKLDLANAWYAIGDSDKTAFPKALNLYEEIKKEAARPESEFYQNAVFGEASTREELDQLEEAFRLFKSLEKTYPAPNVIKIRTARIEERLKKKRK